MALAIFIGGMFLGFILGFTIMALLAAESFSSKPKRRRLPVTKLPASLGLRWRTGQRPSEVGSS